MENARRGSQTDLVYKVSQAPCVTGMAELAQGLGFDLANSFSRYTKLATDLVQRVGATVFETESKLNDASLPRTERHENGGNFFLQYLLGGSFEWRRARVIFDKVFEMPFILVADGHFQRERPFGDAHYVFHLFFCHIHFVR